MNTATSQLTLSISSLANLAIEYWRLGVALPSPPAPARHALRKIGDFLADCSIEVRSLDGAPYDPGLAATVIDTLPDPTLDPGTAIIDETITPMVLFRGTVIKPAEIVVRSSP